MTKRGTGVYGGITDAFLSYNRKDHIFARELRNHLETLGVKVWFDQDPRSIKEDSYDRQAEELLKTECFIALFGTHGLGPEQKRELHTAIKLHDRRKIAIIPVLIPGYKEADDYVLHIAANFEPLDFRTNRKDKVYALASLIRQDIISPRVTARSSRSESPRPRIIAVTGGSGSGTGRLCQALARHVVNIFGKGACRILSMDRYYTGGPNTRSQVSRNGYGWANFDDPDIIDFAQLMDDLGSLCSGASIKIPMYDKKRHALFGFQTCKPPAHFIFVEGTYLLQDKRIRKESDATIFVNVDAEIRFARRLWKDVDALGIKPPGALTYYLRTVKPAFEEWVQPFVKDAHFTLPLEADYRRFDFSRNRFHLDFAHGAKKVLHFLKEERLTPRIRGAVAGSRQ